MNSKASTGAKVPGFITGKPVGIGGSLGRTEATGYGVIFTIREALKELDIRPRGHQRQRQGFGNVAQYAIRLYDQLGGTTVCVSCWDQEDQRVSYSYRKADGIESGRTDVPSPTASAASTRRRPRTWGTRFCRAKNGSSRMWTS